MLLPIAACVKVTTTEDLFRRFGLSEHPHDRRRRDTPARGAAKCLIDGIDKGGGVLIGADRDPTHLFISRSISRNCDEPGRGPTLVPTHNQS
jgi:hypothetical protein